MTDIGAALRTKLLALFAKGYGRTMSVIRIESSGSTYTESTGAATQATTTFAGKGKLGTYSDRVIDGDLIQRGDRQATFVADDVTFRPAAGDKLVDGATTLTIINVKPRELSGTLISHTLQVR